MEHCYYAYYLENSKNVRIDLNIDFENKLEMSEFAKNIFEDYEKEESTPVFSAQHNSQFLLNYLNLLGDLITTENPFEEWKEHLFKSDCLDVEIVLVDKANDICFKKSHTLTKEQSQSIKDCLNQQNEVSFMPSEYDVNVQGIQSAYEPYELIRFEKCEIKF